jgi:diguanylate cyclase (GGDEF)-like protein/PAS domain S-box-containing protein
MAPCIRPFRGPAFQLLSALSIVPSNAPSSGAPDENLSRSFSMLEAERESTQAALRASEARFRAIFDHAAIGIALLASDGLMVETNPALCQFLGYAPGEAQNRYFYHFVPPEDADGLAASVAQVASGDVPDVTVEQRYIRQDGEAVWAALTMSRAAGSREDNASSIIAMVQDISTRKSLEERLTHQASHDPLTNLANRTLFRQRVEVALQRARHRDHVVVMYLDLDNFKSVNDSLGHSAGDQLLVTAAARLLNATRGSDTVARLGGDEFAILLENVREDGEARIVADRIARTMREPIHVGEDNVFVGVSIGIARALEEDGADEVLRNADVAMYTAKGKGKGNYQFFEQSMRTAVVDRLELEADLRTALAREEFELFFQPLVQLESTRIVGVEALVRWNHPRRGMLQPLDFIPVAEETGQIIPLGRWVMSEACRQAHAWWNTLPDTDRSSIAVNVSGRQLRDPSFVEDVAGALAESGLRPSRLVLEITETVIMHRTEGIMQRLRALKELGIQLAIDDFGTGYSSLNYLQQFPIDIIKIDKTFVDGLQRNDAGTALTRTIIGLGFTLGLSTVAEGIEEDQQRTALQELGCVLGQGFLFARPLNAGETTDVLTSSRGVRSTER